RSEGSRKRVTRIHSQFNIMSGTYIPFDDLHSPNNPDEFDIEPFRDDAAEQEEDAIEIAATGEHIHLALTVDDLTLEEKLESLPKSSGVYQFKNGAGKVIYVGK